MLLDLPFGVEQTPRLDQLAGKPMGPLEHQSQPMDPFRRIGVRKRRKE